MLARFELDEADLLFCEDLDRLPCGSAPERAADAGELTDIADALGLPSLGAHRPPHPGRRDRAASLGRSRRVSGTAETHGERGRPDIYRDRRGLKIHHADLAAFRTDLEHAFDALAERYYLHLQVRAEDNSGTRRDPREVRGRQGRLTPLA